MAKKSILAISFLALLMLSILIIPNAPVKAWEYQDGTPSDTKFEKFGPRADKLLIKLYSSPEAEWDALARGEIDITDWPLTKPYHDMFNSPPYNEIINKIFYGNESGMFILEINNNNNTYLGNPPQLVYPNPVYPNPCSVVSFRQAIWHLTDRTILTDLIGPEGEFYEPQYTPVPPSFGIYHSNMPNPYPYDPLAAAALLDADGFPINPATGWRFWDHNGNGVEEPGEYLELKFFIRSDNIYLLYIGMDIAEELESVHVRVNRIYGTITAAQIQVFRDKDFHLYTGDWSLGVDPNHLIIWNSQYYWHPGECYNHGFVNDPILDETSYGVRYANTEEEALINAIDFQVRFATIAASIPLWSYVGTKAMSRRYVGPEAPYTGSYWYGVVNMQGYGIDNYWSFLNMYARGFTRGTGDMTIRYGFSTPEIGSFNPIYAKREHEWKILDLIYEPLLRRNPYNPAELMPWLAENYSIGTWVNPVTGETCSKVKFTIRPDATWSDGTPITTADVRFTLVELDDILKARGLPPPWWYSNIEDILDFEIFDPYNFEVLFDVKSIFAQGWMGDQTELGYYKWPSGMVILPKHIWKPIVETGDPTTLAPDPNMIGSGPWRFGEYNITNSYVLMYANKPGSTVKTSHPGSTPVTSPKGYWRYNPFISGTLIDGNTQAKIDYYTQPHTISLSISNEWYGGPITIDIFYTIGMHYSEYTNIGLSPAGQLGSIWMTSETMDLKGKCPWILTLHIKDPPELAGWSSYTVVIWSTIKEDIAGSTLYDDLGLPGYPYKSQLPSPDIKVDMLSDIRRAAKAFGSYPGHDRWDTVADINGDYKIDMINDIRLIAKKFGWPY
jgi:ABC-type transport system substrate-binding protein